MLLPITAFAQIKVIEQGPRTDMVKLGAIAKSYIQDGLMHVVYRDRTYIDLGEEYEFTLDVFKNEPADLYNAIDAYLNSNNPDPILISTSCCTLEVSKAMFGASELRVTMDGEPQEGYAVLRPKQWKKLLTRG